MLPHLRMVRASMLVVASAGYVLAGTGTAVLAGSASSPAAVKAWRLCAWLLSLVVFGFHFAGERRCRTRPVSGAMYLASAVALGAVGVAALGPLRAHWSEPARLRLALLSIVAWPLLTGVPAFVVALSGRLLLDRAGNASGPHSRAV
jgi:hypothetical protein